LPSQPELPHLKIKNKKSHQIIPLALPARSASPTEEKNNNCYPLIALPSRPDLPHHRKRKNLYNFPCPPGQICLTYRKRKTSHIISLALPARSVSPREKEKDNVQAVKNTPPINEGTGLTSSLFIMS
jgi:hypothetical protein